jgi:hypothetical protein
VGSWSTAGRLLSTAACAELQAVQELEEIVMPEKEETFFLKIFDLVKLTFQK